MKLGSVKKVLVFVFFLFSVVCIFGNSSDKTEDKLLPDVLDETKIEIGESFGEKTKPADSQPKTATDDQSSFDLAVNEKSTTSATSLLQLIGALIIVCILAYIIIKFLKKSTKVFGVDDPYLKTVASMNISQNKSVHVITLGEKAYIIGVTDSNINTIGEVEDKNLITAMNLEAEKNSNSPKKDFVSVFSQYFPNFKKEKDAKDISSDFFDSQRERLSKASNINAEDENG